MKTNATNVLSNTTNIRTTRANGAKSSLPQETSKENVQAGKQKKKPKTSPKVKAATKKKNNVPPQPALPQRNSSCFGFGDDDMETEIPHYNGELTEFDNSKPYRFSLYVQPSKRIRIDPKLIEQVQCWSTLNLTSAVNDLTASKPSRFKKQASDTMMSPDRTQWKVPFSSTPYANSKNKSVMGKPAPPKKNMVQKKLTDILQPSPKRTRSANADQQFTSYFETSASSSNEDEAEMTIKPQKGPKLKTNPVSTKEISESATHEIAAPVTEFRKPRKSYIKKSRPAPEPEDTTPTEEILKSIEKKKTKKSKKAQQEEEEYEKWSRSMNSVFSEIDQFEISFG